MNKKLLFLLPFVLCFISCSFYEDLQRNGYSTYYLKDSNKITSEGIDDLINSINSKSSEGVKNVCGRNLLINNKNISDTILELFDLFGERKITEKFFISGKLISEDTSYGRSTGSECSSFIVKADDQYFVFYYVYCFADDYYDSNVGFESLTVLDQETSARQNCSEDDSDDAEDLQDLQDDDNNSEYGIFIKKADSVSGKEIRMIDDHIVYFTDVSRENEITLSDVKDFFNESNALSDFKNHFGEPNVIYKDWKMYWMLDDGTYVSAAYTKDKIYFAEQVDNEGFVSAINTNGD